MSCTPSPQSLLILIGFFTTQCATCRTSFTQQPLLGYRCVLNGSSSLINWTNTAHAQCVWRCLSSKTCVVISHNFLYNYCELSLDFCDHLEPNDEFIVNIYEAVGATCLLEWVSVSEYDPQRAVAFPKSEGSGDMIAVGRSLHSTGIYPAKHRRFLNFNFRTVVDNRFFDSDDGEVLLLDSDCSTSWVAYSAPNAFPVGAVAGGHIGKETLYVARMKKNGQYSLGYFRKETQLGYFISKRIVTTDTMEILVVV